MGRACPAPLQCLVLAAVAVLLASCSTLPEQPQAALVDRPPAIPAFRSAWETAVIIRVPAPDGVQIPVRTYGRDGRRTPVLMTHGLQSHTGWFAQSGRQMARLGHPVYALDRRGSGLSTELRGHTASFIQMADDIGTVARHAMQKHGTGSVHVVGHCFGAIPATAFACRSPMMVRSLILPTPGLYTYTDLTTGEKLKVAGSNTFRRVSYLPIPLAAEMFTDDPAYQQFVKSDPLTLREATTTTFYQTHKARKYIEHHRQNLTMPVFMALAKHDVICDNAADQKFLDGIPAAPKRLRSYEARHILEFSKDRDPFFTDLATWLKQTERHP